jgi:hypothetical protein
LGVDTNCFYFGLDAHKIAGGIYINVIIIFLLVVSWIDLLNSTDFTLMGMNVRKDDHDHDMDHGYTEVTPILLNV